MWYVSAGRTANCAAAVDGAVDGDDDGHDSGSEIGVEAPPTAGSGVSNAEGLTRVLALTFRPDIGRAHWMSTSDSIAIPFYWETGTSTTQQPWAARLVFTRLRGPHTLHTTAATPLLLGFCQARRGAFSIPHPYASIRTLERSE